MLSKTVLDQLNNQIDVEFYSANLYLQMGSWCESSNFVGAAKFLIAHADEEIGHMRKIFHYINDTGAQAIIPALEQPPYEYESLSDIFGKIYQHECSVTGTINNLVSIANKEKDYSTLNFLQWYVAEQHEEERLFMSIVERLNLVGDSGRGLLMIDNELGEKASA